MPRFWLRVVAAVYRYGRGETPEEAFARQAARLKPGFKPTGHIWGDVIRGTFGEDER